MKQNVLDYPYLLIKDIKKVLPPRIPAFSFFGETGELFCDKKNSKWNNPCLPERVAQEFKVGNDYIPYEGKVFWKAEYDSEVNVQMYNASREVTPVALELLARAGFDDYINSLEQKKGKMVRNTDLFPHLERDYAFRKAFIIPETNYRLGFSFENDHKLKPIAGKANLVLFEKKLFSLGFQGIVQGIPSHWYLEPCLELAKIEYKRIGYVQRMLGLGLSP